MSRTGLALLGCGFAADYYVTTMVNHPELKLCGVHDLDADRARHLATTRNAGKVYTSLEELLGDAEVDLVVNLTPPDAHFETTRACLLAGKHVYSEKPLALDPTDMRELGALARARGVSLSGAPCNLFGEAAQTMWKALRDGVAGRVRLAYVELDEGPVLHSRFRELRSRSGCQWPFADEFQTGVTVEHAAYSVSWLAAFFGPVARVTAFSALLAPDKAPEIAPERMAQDFSVACLEHESGVVARVTCGMIGEYDHRLRLFGDRGVLACTNTWNLGATVTFKPVAGVAARSLPRRVVGRIRRRGKRFRGVPPGAFRVPMVRHPRFAWEPPLLMDFAGGPAEQAAAIREGRDPRLTADFVAHVHEVVIAMQAHRTEAVTKVDSRFDAVEPMPWAASTTLRSSPPSDSNR